MRVRLSHPRSAEGEDVTAFWLITYSDMVTLLLSFFLLMFSFTLLGEQRQEELVRSLNVVAEGGQAKPEPAADLEARARQIAAQLRGREAAWVETSEAEVTVGLPSSVTFALGDAALQPQAREDLTKVARILAGMPNLVRIEGHTDDLPIRSAAFPSNWHLSSARAQSVLRLFLEHGLDPRRLQVVGYADTRPRRPNDSEEGRRANRRIEIKLPRGGGAVPPPAAASQRSQGVDP
ncbi:MAG: OmpA family protein [Deltaproteobacteria bacterium]|nr:OmpA family protein [Deltaproteobacteria bacterium]